jgi:hypothetical protein
MIMRMTQYWTASARCWPFSMKRRACLSITKKGSIISPLKYILNAKTIALEKRICKAANPLSVYTESVFLYKPAIEL